MTEDHRYRLIFEEFLDKTEDGFIVVDRDGVITDINQNYCDFLAKRREDVVGRPIGSVITTTSMYDVLARRHRGDGGSGVYLQPYGQGETRDEAEVYAVANRFCVFDETGELIGAAAHMKFRQRAVDTAREITEAELRYYKEAYQESLSSASGFSDLIGKDPKLLELKRAGTQAARTDFPVLITGETGTGKEVVAKAIHLESDRRNGPFVAVNCGAIPDNLLESELFGYEEGAFTGAKKGGRLGLLEISHQGTLFLDEVEGMSPALQVKLLRVLQEREIMRVGGTSIIPIDVRIVAATNESLERKVAEGTFRRDLYYRLSTLPIVIPPLSERGDDLFLILEQFQKELGGSFRLTPQVRGFLKSYSWPGNIRELRNVVEYFLYTGHDPITMEDLPPTVFHRAPQAPIRQLPETPQQPSSDVFRFVLEQLYQASEARQPIGRERLLQLARDAFVPTSQQEIRSILAQMADQGLVRVSRGRGGSQLTPEGRQLYETGRI